MPKDGTTLQMDESHPGNLFYLWANRHILVKDESKIPHRTTAGHMNAIKGQQTHTFSSTVCIYFLINNKANMSSLSLSFWSHWQTNSTVLNCSLWCSCCSALQPLWVWCSSTWSSSPPSAASAYSDPKAWSRSSEQNKDYCHQLQSNTVELECVEPQDERLWGSPQQQRQQLLGQHFQTSKNWNQTGWKTMRSNEERVEKCYENMKCVIITVMKMTL